MSRGVNRLPPLDNRKLNRGVKDEETLGKAPIEGITLVLNHDIEILRS